MLNVHVYFGTKYDLNLLEQQVIVTCFHVTFMTLVVQLTGICTDVLT